MGADWKKVGTAHYIEGLYHTEFEVLTTGGWAQKKGFDDLTFSIQLGMA